MEPRTVLPTIGCVRQIRQWLAAMHRAGGKTARPMRAGVRARAGALASGLVAAWLGTGLCQATAGTLGKAQLEQHFAPPLVVGEQLVHVPAWPIFRNNGATHELHGYAFETIDVEPVAGYSGKPVNLLVVIDPGGTLLQAQVLAHAEPIFRSASGTAQLQRFASQYPGDPAVTVNHQVQILGAKAQRNVTPTVATLHGIVTGTVTARAIDRSVMESAAQVAQGATLAASDAADPHAAREAAEHTRGPDDRYQRMGWNGLVSAGLLQHVTLLQRELDSAFRETPQAPADAAGLWRPRAAAVDLWVSPVGLPQAGRNLLQPARWREVRALREAGTPVLLVIDSGRYALQAPASGPGTPGAAPLRRGTGLSVQQAGRTHALRALPWQGGLKLVGTASRVGTDAAVHWFAVDATQGVAFDPLQPMQLLIKPWRLNADAATGATPVRFERAFEIADAAAYRPVRETPRWLEAGWQRRHDLVAIGAGLLLLAAALVAQRWVAATPRRLAGLRTAYLLFTLFFIGWHAQGQLTIVSLTSLIEALAAGRSAAFLLLDPVAVLLWAFTGITLFIWGRGTFCGWLCPFGALQELAAKAAGLAGLAQKRLRAPLDRGLKRVKYAVLAVLCASAAASPAWTEALVEVEPFKTSISLHFQREWPYVAFAAGCVLLGLLVYRGYCRYLCPLGALLALAARVRLLAWVPRKAECGTPCQTCRHRCGYQAIEPAGHIDYGECFQCLDCVQLHDNPAQCLPLVAQARGRPVPVRIVPAGMARPRPAGAAR